MPKAKHNQAITIAADDYHSRVVSFFDANLASAGPPPSGSCDPHADLTNRRKLVSGEDHSLTLDAVGDRFVVYCKWKKTEPNHGLDQTPLQQRRVRRAAMRFQQRCGHSSRTKASSPPSTSKAAPTR